MRPTKPAKKIFISISNILFFLLLMNSSKFLRSGIADMPKELILDKLKENEMIRVAKFINLFLFFLWT